MSVGFSQFCEKDRFNGDEKFSKALALSTSILAMFENNSGNFPKTSGTVYLGDDAYRSQLNLKV